MVDPCGWRGRESAACGDGLLEVGVEACDDGNQDDGDGCTSLCELAICGDGFIQKDVEQCDDENKVNLGTAYSDNCPAGQVLTGFMGTLKAGSHAALRGMCSVPTLVVQDDAFVVKTGPGAALPQRGGPGDTQWTRMCATHHVLVGFSGSAGAGVNQLTFRCAPLVISEGPGGVFTIGPGTATQLMVVGAAGGMPFAPASCPMGQVATAQRLRASTVIAAFGLGCSAVSLGF